MPLGKPPAWSRRSRITSNTYHAPHGRSRHPTPRPRQKVRAHHSRWRTHPRHQRRLRLDEPLRPRALPAPGPVGPRVVAAGAELVAGGSLGDGSRVVASGRAGGVRRGRCTGAEDHPKSPMPDMARHRLEGHGNDGATWLFRSTRCTSKLGEPLGQRHCDRRLLACSSAVAHRRFARRLSRPSPLM